MTKRQRSLNAQLAKITGDLEYTLWNRRDRNNTLVAKWAKRRHNKAFRRMCRSLAIEGAVAPALARFRY